MKRLNLTLAFVLILSLLGLSHAQERHEIAFPDLPGYKTLKCDLHMHTVFSDGTVWPTVRVDEAWRLGLDAIAISDHVERKKHAKDVSTAQNRPYETAVGQARRLDTLLIRGGEISRETPPGHFNAIFLSDVEPINTEKFVEAVKRANDQGAFVFWNHQGWKGEERGSWRKVHSTLYDNKWLHGMEVCNNDDYYPSAHRWCLEKGLTMLGNSDIHQPDLREKCSPEDHRTMTLVFAKEKTLPAIKEALEQGRTAVWFENQIIGREELLRPFFAECVKLETPHLRTADAVFTKIHNLSDLDIVLERTGNFGPRQLRLPARTTNIVRIGTSTPQDLPKMQYSATNFLIAPGKSLTVMLRVPESEVGVKQPDAEN